VVIPRRGGGDSQKQNGGEPPEEEILPRPEPKDTHEGKRRPLGLMIFPHESPDRNELGWLIGSNVYINTGHPAYKTYKKTIKKTPDNYHFVVSIAWVLSGCLEAKKSPHKFINQFLSNWGIRI